MEETLSVRQNGQHKLQNKERMKDIEFLENVFCKCWVNEYTKQYDTVGMQVWLEEGWSGCKWNIGRSYLT